MKLVEIPTGDGTTVKRYMIHTFSPLDGRAILAGYPLAVLAKDHTYKGNEAAMKMLMRYVSVHELDDSGDALPDNEGIHLVSDELINEHVPDWWTLVQLEFEALKYNCSFLQGTNFLETAKAGMVDMLRKLVADHLERLNK